VSQHAHDELDALISSLHPCSLLPSHFLGKGAGNTEDDPDDRQGHKRSPCGLFLVAAWSVYTYADDSKRANLIIENDDRKHD
jgi:hypothetical protein